jgi:hypothetical protein
MGLVRSDTIPRITDPRTNNPDGSSIVTPPASLCSGKITEVAPSVMSVPPCCTNLCISCNRWK